MRTKILRYNKKQLPKITGLQNITPENESLTVKDQKYLTGGKELFRTDAFKSEEFFDMF